MADEQTFGARLKQFLEQKGLTQQQLSDAGGITKSGLAKLEQDNYSPTWPTVQSLARALGVSCAAFEGTVEPPPASTRTPGRKGRPPKQAPAEPPGEKWAGQLRQQEQPPAGERKAEKARGRKGKPKDKGG
jgi:transcriptional regulator with XRE-family HTH domain